MFNILFRDLKRSWIYYLGIFLAVFGSILATGVFMHEAMKVVGQKWADDKCNYDYYSGVIRFENSAYLGDRSPDGYILYETSEDIIDFYDNLTYNGEKVDYAIMRNSSLTVEDKYIGGVSIDIKCAQNLRLNNTDGAWFSNTYYEDYSEVIISEALKETYVKGQFYDTDSGRIKIIGYITSGYTFSAYNGRVVDVDYSETGSFIMCREVEPVARCRTLILSSVSAEFSEYLFGEFSNRYYKDFEAAYGGTNRSYQDIMFIAILANVIMMLSIAVNALITKRNGAKLQAVMFMCGATRRQVIAAEFIKTVSMFFIPFFIALGIAPLIGESADIVTMLLGSIVIFISFCIPQTVKLANVLKTKHLDVLRGN